jgi:polyphosphate kinase
MSDTKEISPVESPSGPSPAQQPDFRKTRRTHTASEGEIYEESSTAVSTSNEPSVSPIENLSAASLYLNRELTWLEFNRRVLHEAMDERTPLLERIKFLSIVSSNLDEFFMKRIGGLKQQVGAGIRSMFDVHHSERRSEWEMQPDGTYIQSMPAEGEDPRGSHEILISLAEKRQKKVARLKKRKAPPPGRRNL